jgi:drug/metabolite transporter (DMT)-like permease
VVTFTSMGIGGVTLLVTGVLLQGLGNLGWREWSIIAWLAAVNTALAFTLWNRSLQTLSAVESSVLNGMMLPQIVVLSWIFLGEALSPKEIAGLVLAAAGTLLVQIRR